MTNERNEQLFGHHIRTARNQRGWSLDQLGKLCGIDKSDLAKYENNARPMKSATLVSIAQALGILPDELRAGTWGRTLNLFQFPANPAPYRAGTVIGNSVCRLYGNHTHPIELTLRYSQEPINLHEDIALVYDDIRKKNVRDAERAGKEYFNGPNTRLLRLIPNTTGAEEKAGAILEMGPVSWEEFMVLNGSLDEEVWPGDPQNTIRKRFANAEDVYRNQSDLRWSKLSNILTCFMMPITVDGYGFVQLRSNRTALTDGRLTCGVTENINRYKDEAPTRWPHQRRNALQDKKESRPPENYRINAEHAPSPVLCALRGLCEELSEGLYHQVKSTPEVVKFLNLGFNLDRYHPVLIGVIELPLTRHQVRELIETSPGKDLEHSTLYDLPLDVSHPDTKPYVVDPNAWDTSGLASFISAVNYWQKEPL